MSYYKQFAEMLGLELDEEFSLATPNGEKANLNTYKIIEDGIYYQSATHDAWWAASDEILGFLLMGEFKAVPKPWKPKKGDIYWYYSEPFQHAFSSEWIGSLCDLLYWKSGNFFKTKKEANEKGYVFWKELEKEYEKE